MSFIHGSRARVYVNGFDLSSFLKSVSSSAEVGVHDSSTLTAIAKTYIPGLEDATLSAEGLFSGEVGAIDPVLFAALRGRSPVIWSWLPSGDIDGSFGYGLSAMKTSYEIESPADDLVSISAEAQSTIGRERAQILHPMGTRIATDVWTIRASAVDNDWISVCWSPERGLFVAVANTGIGNRVMTSPDGITWTIRASAANNDWLSVCWSPERGLFVAVAHTGVGNRVMTSPDGLVWTIRTSAADNDWHSVCWSPERGLFVAVAFSGVGNRVMTSPFAGDGISRDNMALTNLGGVAYLQVTAASGTAPSLRVRIQHSADAITWANLITFAAVTASNNAQRVAITGTVNRHIRAQWTILGTSPSFTFFVAFGRY